jgi:hypothetical protein
MIVIKIIDYRNYIFNPVIGIKYMP